ncbi:3D domain-containing protein [Patescibacteria group bacterium]
MKSPIIRRARKNFGKPYMSVVAIAIAVAATVAIGGRLAQAEQSNDQASAELQAKIAAELDKRNAEQHERANDLKQARYAEQKNTQKIAKAQAAKQAHEEKLAEEQRLAKQRQQSRAVAMHRSQSSGRGGTGQYTGTYYTPHASENGGHNLSATGENLYDLLGQDVVAYNNAPLNSQVKVNGKWYTVKDRMASYNGDKIDFLVGSNEEARQGGKHSVTIEEIRPPQ